MDREGYRAMLKSRKLPEEKIDAAISICESFEKYLQNLGGSPGEVAVWKYCKGLIAEQQNSYDNLLALARYGLFTRNNTIYVAILELLDGAEAQPNLYERVGVLFGEAVRDKVFAGIGISPLGLPPTEKPYDMFPVIERLVGKLGHQTVEQLLSACLRDLPDEYYQDARDRYAQSSDIDAYLREKHRAFVLQLHKCQQDGVLFFSQEIDDEVVQYVEQHPEFECGVRESNILYITKIPYNTKCYLAETDPVMKRFYACHCPWARQEIKKGNIRLDPVFCNCSGGYSKKPWEVIFGQTLKVDMLESALKGDFRCRFAVHLPDNYLV